MFAATAPFQERSPQTTTTLTSSESSSSSSSSCEQKKNQALLHDFAVRAATSAASQASANQRLTRTVKERSQPSPPQAAANISNNSKLETAEKNGAAVHPPNPSNPNAFLQEFAVRAAMSAARQASSRTLVAESTATTVDYSESYHCEEDDTTEVDGDDNIHVSSNLNLNSSSSNFNVNVLSNTSELDEEARDLLERGAAVLTVHQRKVSTLLVVMFLFTVMGIVTPLVAFCVLVAGLGTGMYVVQKPPLILIEQKDGHYHYPHQSSLLSSKTTSKSRITASATAITAVTRTATAKSISSAEKGKRQRGRRPPSSVELAVRAAQRQQHLQQQQQ